MKEALGPQYDTENSIWYLKPNFWVLGPLGYCRLLNIHPKSAPFSNVMSMEE